MPPILAVPGTGFVENSVNAHRSDITVVSDWIEGSALFFNQPVSKMEVRDFLCDNGYYQEQKFAMTFIDLLWAELTIRAARVRAFPVFSIDKFRIVPHLGWRDAVGYTFCLMLTHLQRYSKLQYPRLFAKAYVKQGDLFERFSEESLMRLGWKTLRTGWASGINTPKFRDIVNEVAHELDETWINAPAAALLKHAKEEGLDLVVHMPFTDKRVGRPYFLVQCASGDNWKEKLHTPSIEVWGKLIVFTTAAGRGFCFPLSLDDDEFRITCARCAGLLLDRYRLLSSGTGMANNLSATLRKDIEDWLSPRISVLPTA